MASLRGLSCLVLLAVVAALVGADESMKMGRSEVKIAARAGTMQFRRQRLNKNGSVTDMKPVNIRMAQMVQLDKDFKEVTNCTVPSRRRRSMSGQEGKPGQGDMPGKGEITGHGDMPGGDGNSTFDPSKGGIAHRARTWAGENGMGKGKRFSDFDKQEFEVGKKQEGVKLRHSTLKAATRRFSANLGAHVGQLAIDLAMPEADGEIDIDGEKQKLKKGDMKFNIALDSWQWCGEEDAEGAAAFLDVYVEVNSTLQPTLKRARSASSPATFDLGDNATMSFSGKVGSHIFTSTAYSCRKKYPASIIEFRFCCP